ncbi:alpha/beta fold hydrolase [Actinomadura atramentaria]|uniref:alpha/beta fold hydrolase n=1 Tax=Actinomadura atramentaria TaxID=1990 RepID=UPI0004772FB8|nr:alpha/beta hydrolase [Actinomadura atramentaria]
MPFADLGDARLFFTDDAPRAAPTGPPLLLVHGFAADSADWSFHVPELNRARRVVAPDLRGHGHSSAPPTGYRPQDLAADLLRLLDRLGVARADVIGHSLGTMVGSVLAVEHPDRVRALVCVDPAYGQPTSVAAHFPAMFAGLRGPDPYATALANDAWCYTPDSPAWLREWHRRKILATAPAALAQAFAGLYEGPDAFGVRPASAAYLARRAVPVLSLWSQAQAGSAAWERDLPGHPASRSVLVPGGGHRLHAERPEEFLQTVTAWLDALDKE